MLSIGKVAAGPEAGAYYADQVAPDPAGYYDGEGEASGVWTGSGAGLFGLDGEVSREDLEAVLAGAGRRTIAKGGIGGFDLTFRAPKSVSVLWAVGDPAVAEELRAGHDAAVAEALGYLEREACWARRGAGGVVQVRGDGLVAAQFTHRTSRAGDPLLHTHVVAGNLTRGPDGRWTALDGRHLYQQARTAGFLYQAVLREQLTERLGVEWQPVERGVADIKGVSREVVEHFSQRRQAILERMAERGERSAAAAQVAALDTRQAKQRVPLARQHADWRSRAAELGLDREAVRELTGQLAPRIGAPAIDVEALTQQASTFTRADVLRAVAESAQAGSSMEMLERRADAVLAQHYMVHVGEDHLKHPRYTTQSLLRTEQELLRSQQDRRDSWRPLVDQATVEAALAERPTIGEDQADVVRRLTYGRAGIEVVRAPAGTGKTFAMDAARDAWEQAGHEVTGCALSARAALELEDQAGIASTTITRLLHRLDEGHRLTQGGVLVVDEAGMVGTRALAKLAQAAEEQELKLVLVGDDRQLPEIDAGGAFRALADAAPPAELTEVRRQREAWDRQALEQLRRGDVERWAKAYRDAGRITVTPSAEQARAGLVNDWSQADGDAVMIAYRRADVADLNARARQLLQAQKRLPADELVIGERAFSTGDRVVATVNNRPAGILNGQRGTIEHTDGERQSVQVRLDAGTRVALDQGSLQRGDLDHGYAITAHRAQGATVDRAFVLGSEDLYREWGYTALSRHREVARFYVTRTDLGLNQDRAPEPDPIAAGLTRLLGRSQAEEFASTQLRDLSDEQLARERARLAHRLQGTQLPSPTGHLADKLEGLERMRRGVDARAERLQAERDNTSWLKRDERKKLAAYQQQAAAAEHRLATLNQEVAADLAEQAGHRARWIEHHGPEAERYLQLADEAAQRSTHRGTVDQRLERFHRPGPRLEMPDPGIAIDGGLDMG